jgi:anti-sigma regulatory factor (Ser/Thr protein kinase)
MALAEPFVEGARLADLRLVISEVITNAVRHGGLGDLLIAVTPKRDYLCVQVTDTGDGFAPRPRAYAPDDNGGFGLFLIERLTRRWGLTREDSNTRVWFEFDFGEPLAAAA